MMRIVVTGGEGFIGSTLRLRLLEIGQKDVASLTLRSTTEDWTAALTRADVVFHLAGVNRTEYVEDFESTNVSLTARICDTLARAGRRATIVYSSSTQATLNNPYGRSKRKAEEIVERYAIETEARACVVRFPNVFGKWAQPNYNSAVATFCYNITRDLPVTIHDRNARLTLMHVDDAVELIVGLLPPSDASGRIDVKRVYETTVGEVAAMLEGFARDRVNGNIGAVGGGLARALYSTFVSYLRPSQFAYPIERHQDARGCFSEMLRTSDSGQISYFTAHPGVTRGEHYHHTKTEKFLVVQGHARFAFRHLITNERHTCDVTSDNPHVVDTAPGWVHSVTNIGESELVVLLWANEVFDQNRPDTFASRINP